MKLINNVTLGADPELFYKNEEELVSAEGLVGGTKKNPKMISDDGHAIQEDNVLVEFNIPPSKTKDEFKYNINYCLEYIREVGLLQGLTLSDLASNEMNPKYLQTAHARQFSCERDFNAHTRSVNPIINNNTNLRSAGKMAARLHRNM